MGRTAVTLLRTPDGGIQPQAAVDGKGRAHLIYFKGDPKSGELLYTRVDEGDKFAPPISVNGEGKGAMALGNIRGAQLAIGKNGRAHVAWMGGGKIMYYARLNDAAAAFEEPRNVLTWAEGLDGGGTVAADTTGNVYVAWHAHPSGNPSGELGRAVYVTRSSDDGKTFSREEQANGSQIGACACCGMRARADDQGHLYLLYRAMNEMSRDMILLASNDRGKTFKSAVITRWEINTCPMSSSTLADTSNGILAATEKAGQVSFARVPLDSMIPLDSTVAPGKGRAKHPVILVNGSGETLLAWTENMGWAKGGSLAWQLYDSAHKPKGDKGTAPGVPVWSLPTGFTKPNGDFVIVY